MARVTKITYSRKVQPRQFESLEVIYEVALTKADDEGEQMEILVAQVEDEAERACAFVAARYARRAEEAEAARTGRSIPQGRAVRGEVGPGGPAFPAAEEDPYADPGIPPAAIPPREEEESERHPPVCISEGCGAQVTNGQRAVSLHRYGCVLCPAHQKNRPRIDLAAAG